MLECKQKYLNSSNDFLNVEQTSKFKQDEKL